MAIVPLFSVAPSAMVPSWQLRQSLAEPVGCWADLPGNVLKVPATVPDANELLP
jgi:hypothetical protein